jgi:hypothetical protein
MVAAGQMPNARDRQVGECRIGRAGEFGALMSSANAKAINGTGDRDRKLATCQRQSRPRLRYARSASAEATRRNVPTHTRREADGPQKSTQQSWRNLDDEGFRRHPAFIKTGATGKTIARKIGRSVVALYQKVSIEGISLSGRPALRRPIKAKKAKTAAASKTRRSR